MRIRAVTVGLLTAACAPIPDAGDDDTDGAVYDPSEPGVYAAGVVRRTLVDEARDGRSIPLAVVYPTDDPASSVSLQGLADAAHVPRLAGVLGTAPEGCASPTVSVAPNATPAAGTWPVVVLSHCHHCLGVSLMSIAADWASDGWVVLLPDHLGNTLIDVLDGNGGSVNNTMLTTRHADVDRVLDAASVGEIEVDGLSLDADTMVVGGHSFGAMTAGRVMRDDPQLRAALYLYAPPDNPLYETLDVSLEGRPQWFGLATEDGSILEAGNQILRANAADAGGPSALVSFVDAGHWSMSDLLAVVPEQDAGCGEGERWDGTGTFSYPDPGEVRADVAAEGRAFLDAVVRDVPAATRWLAQGDDDAILRTWRP